MAFGIIGRTTVVFVWERLPDDLMALVVAASVPRIAFWPLAKS